MCCCKNGGDVTLQLLLRAASQCWMVPSLVCLLLGTGFSLAAAFSHKWIELRCQEGYMVQFGLSHVCYKNKTIDTDDVELFCTESDDSNGKATHVVPGVANAENDS